VAAAEAAAEVAEEAIEAITEEIEDATDDALAATEVVDAVAAEAAEVAVAAALPEEADDELQTTASGTVTPWVVQNDLAKATACAWSDALHAPARQHAMPLRKPALLHMHLASRLPQPPMEEPEVNCVTQDCCLVILVAVQETMHIYNDQGRLRIKKEQMELTAHWGRLVTCAAL
jgi:hypothetical protein